MVVHPWTQPTADHVALQCLLLKKKKPVQVSGLTQFKLVFFKDQLYNTVFFLATPTACVHFWARDQTHTTAATQAAALTTLDP